MLYTRVYYGITYRYTTPYHSTTYSSSIVFDWYWHLN